MSPKDDGIRIDFYDDWMLPQVVEMFSAQYKRDPDQEREAILAFYEHPYQQEHGIRLVALDGERVCGFQSFFSWPYRYDEQELRTFQSGRSLVSPDYRGHGIFARLLDHLTQTQDRPDIDFLMGFPVEMSYGSFLRNGWLNPLDLAWYARPLHPLAPLRHYSPVDPDFLFDRQPSSITPYYSPRCFTLSKETAFATWRAAVRTGDRYYYVHYGDNRGNVRFEVKPNRRGRVLELVVGDIVRDSGDSALLGRAVRELIRVSGRHRFLTTLTIAINPHCEDSSLRHALKRSGFVRLRPTIHFIVKYIEQRPDIEDPQRWSLLRSDIDTW